MSLPVLLQGIYLFATVFALGVIAIESMGLLGDADHDGGGHDAGDMSVGDHAGHDGGGGEDAHGESGVAVKGNAWQQQRRSGHALFTLLGALRLVIYFGLGFGPMGLVATVLGANAFVSLVCALAAGVVAAVLYRRVIRFQQKDLDSTVHDRDLIGERAEVLIAIHPGEIGRVRIALDQLVCDRYAASDADDFIPKGARVAVVAVSDRGLIVAMPEA
ncbi:NfeD family protein [Salinisphaera sp. Q1T1-3]|uniref:NfeD family protein n=1 Tax=Salinisphaera sp. Q1T1-3 TaxID=2321229 RepID=UPI000E76E6A1|nr:NfeD family protein [Salinisphaera sp. Q1T1-3]RJS94149.1 hypothetical protein D3260_06200 [Salinisphaera sp. Q1T1-3]